MLAFMLALVLAQPASRHATDLTFEAKAPARVKLDDDFQVTLTLKNNGKVALPVVKPSDGSESNWREPYVWFTAEREDRGAWTPVPKLQLARCGLFDFDWDKDTVMLAPGKTLDVSQWVNRPQYSVAIDKPGRYRFVAHYTFGTATRGEVKPTKGMQDVAPFELASAPFIVERVR